MITADESVFPNNAVSLLKTRFDLIDPELEVFRRPLRNTDPVQSVGVFGTLWRPDEESYEIRDMPSPGPSEPTLQRYSMMIQALVRDMEEERGLIVHSVLATLLRSMLYRDNPLRVGLASLSSTLSGSTETTKRWGLGQTRYLSNEIRGEWLFLSTLEFWLETEST